MFNHLLNLPIENYDYNKQYYIFKLSFGIQYIKRLLVVPPTEENKSVKEERSLQWASTTIATKLGTIKLSKIATCMSLGSNENLQSTTREKNKEQQLLCHLRNKEDQRFA